MVFLALAILGLVSDDELTVRGVYVVMVPAAWFVFVPLAHASLLSGIVLSLGTTWGLFRHYWVVLKLLITIFATVILLIYMQTFSEMAGLATDPAVDLAVVRNPSPMVHAILALVLLLVATVFGVYKPFGMTAYGKRKQKEQREASPPTASERVTRAVVQSSSIPSWLYVAGFIGLVVVLVFVVLHLTGGGFQH
jgi:hypothetical protein